MFSWLKKKQFGTPDSVRVQQQPGDAFPLVKGAKLWPEEEVVLALPAALIGGVEKIGDVLLCDDDAGLTLNEEVGAWYVKLQPGMEFSLAKSCEILLVGSDKRPRFFKYLPPPSKSAK